MLSYILVRHYPQILGRDDLIYQIGAWMNVAKLQYLLFHTLILDFPCLPVAEGGSELCNILFQLQTISLQVN